MSIETVRFEQAEGKLAAYEKALDAARQQATTERVRLKSEGLDKEKTQLATADRPGTEESRVMELPAKPSLPRPTSVAARPPAKPGSTAWQAKAVTMVQAFGRGLNACGLRTEPSGLPRKLLAAMIL